MQHRHYPEGEYQKWEGEPLPAWRLAQIQRALPERDRFGFLLALSEEIADQVLAIEPATAPVEGKQPND